MKIVPVREKGNMSYIDGINYNLIKNNLNLYTKRTCSDNSELYITSKLNMLYEQTISNKNHYESRRKLRKMIENSKLDEVI